MSTAKRPLIDFADLASGGTPSKSNSDYWGGRIPWLTPKDMARFNGETVDSVSETAIGNGTRLAPENSLFIAVRGMSLHKEIRIIRPRKEMTFNQDIKAVMPKEAVDSAYLYYAMLNEVPKLLGQVHAAGHGTGVLSTDLLKQVPVSDFEPEYQSVIGQKLGEMDSKIELNRQMNETLEAMARAVFKDWFVNFGPSVRKAADITDPVQILGGLLPDPTRAETLAALFPDSFGESGLPEGWEAKTLGDVVEPRKGRNITKKTVVPGDVPVVAGGLNPAYYHNTPNVIGPAITASASGANAGFVHLYNQDIWASDCSFICSEQTDHLFTVYALLSSRQDEIYSMQQGAAQPHVYPSDLKRLTIVDAPAPIWQALEALLTPMFELVANNEQENHTLAATRDLLLPKLMSGEIRLKNAENAA